MVNIDAIDACINHYEYCPEGRPGGKSVKAREQLSALVERIKELETMIGEDARTIYKQSKYIAELEHKAQQNCVGAK